MHPAPHSRVSNRVFKNDGSLSSFSRKIDMGYMLQLYPIELREVLHVLRDIRNDFAHSAERLEFQSVDISKQVVKIKGLIGQAIGHGAYHVSLIGNMASKYTGVPVQRKRALDHVGPFTISFDSDDPRSTFLTTIKWFLVYFEQVRDEFSHLQIDLQPWPGRSAQPAPKATDRPNPSHHKKRVRRR